METENTKLKFPKLNINQIELRIGNTTPKGAKLLAFQNARCGMDILDEVVGAENWKMSHPDGNISICRIEIFDDRKKEWISKDGVGTESNVEQVKGLASDSFKRACILWGIGRELYSFPTIFALGYEPTKHKFAKFIIDSIEPFKAHAEIKDKIIDEISIISIK